MGGSCVPNGGKWEIGPTLITLTDVGKQVFGVEAFVRIPILALLASSHPLQNIQEMHRDHVPQILPGFHLLGSTDVSYNQGMVRFHSPAISPTNISLSDVHIFTVQGHPEFTQPIITKIIEARTMQGVIDEATAADAVRRAGLQNDGVAVVGKAIWGVLGVSGP
jgi:GMP synthase-like glutamine amidotransferase